jgi:hypothetical protein
LLVPSLLGSALVLAGCTTEDNNLGKEAEADGGRDARASDGPRATCEQDGRTYQVGETVVLGACTTCVCQQDGTIGLCTGLCPPDASTKADATVTCTQNGNTYQVGETVVLSACTTCVCQQDGTVGMCTGACPPDASTKLDATVTCTQNGNTYQVGETVVLSACTTCVCQQDGTLGMCTGACPPDAGNQDAAISDAAPDVMATEAAPPPNYTCRDDADCCVHVDTCINHAWLYSKAPGASGMPTLPPITTCNRCTPPGIQVRCSSGQCTGEQISTGMSFSSPIYSSHCGVVPLDAGAASAFPAAYAGAEPVSWGC